MSRSLPTAPQCGARAPARLMPRSPGANNRNSLPGHRWSSATAVAEPESPEAHAGNQIFM